MADAEFDISQLSEDQQLALQQFTSVTDQELSAAVPLLRRCEWNVQIAIARFFDGEPPEQPTEPDIPPPQVERRHETLANGFSSELRRRTHHNLEPAPRVVPQPPGQINQDPPFLVSLFLAPVNLVYGLVSRIFGAFAYLFPFLPRLLARLRTRPSATPSQRDAGGRRTPLGPQDTTQRFLREFEQDYGTHTLPFLETGYSRAFDLAKRDLKFLLVIPISPEHADTASFIRNTLLSQSVTRFLNDPANNVLVWAGSLQDAEPYQVAAALNITRFPAAALIAHTPAVSSTAMSVVARIAGPVAPETFTAQLHNAMRQHSGALEQTRSTRAEQERSRTLREEQNSAYERSLAQDRERARLKREEEEEKSRAERAEVERTQREEQQARDLEAWRRWRASSIAEEPGPETKDAVRLSIRLGSGERVMRKFRPETEIEEVYAFVECYDVLNESPTEKDDKPDRFEHEYHFRLVSPMPREVYGLKGGGTVRQKIGRSGNLIVERIEDEEGSSSGDE